jgi:hypothetical protein
MRKIEILLKELEEREVSLIAWSEDGSGAAHVTRREVILPYPSDEVTLGVCFHEIAHVELGLEGPPYAYELRAEERALAMLQTYGLDTGAYRRHAQKNVRAVIRKSARLGRLDINTVPKAVWDFCGINTDIYSVLL